MLTFRKAISTDFEFMKFIENKSFNEIDRFKTYQIKYFLKNPNNSIITDIILADDKKIGWATYFTNKKAKWIRLYTFCIDPLYRGKGYGKEYLKKRLKEFSKKYKKIFLEVRKSNVSAIKLYESLGFKRKKILEKYYLNEDGFKMVHCFGENL